MTLLVPMATSRWICPADRNSVVENLVCTGRKERTFVEVMIARLHEKYLRKGEFKSPLLMLQIAEVSLSLQISELIAQVVIVSNKNGGFATALAFFFSSWLSSCIRVSLCSDSYFLRFGLGIVLSDNCIGCLRCVEWFTVTVNCCQSLFQLRK